MIDIAKLVSSIEAADNHLSKTEKYTKALRLLCSTAREYNRTREALELLRDSVGLNKPFRILDLPREIRNQIYTHCLQAKSAVNTTSQPPLNVNERDDLYKPPTPGLLLVNGQIAAEAVDILYPKNVFRFEQPIDLFEFESMIGLECGRRVKQMSLSIRLPPESDGISNRSLLAKSDFVSIANWVKTLRLCGFQQVRHLDIHVEQIDRVSLLSMPEDLQEAIKEFLGRQQPMDEIPHLSLHGFKEEVRQNFPRGWKVVIHQNTPS